MFLKAKFNGESRVQILVQTLYCTGMLKISCKQLKPNDDDDDHFYIVLFSALKQTHRARM